MIYWQGNRYWKMGMASVRILSMHHASSSGSVKNESVLLSLKRRYRYFASWKVFKPFKNCGGVADSSIFADISITKWCSEFLKSKKPADRNQ